jgi:protein ImuB
MFACIYIPNASAEADALLLECASAFSPRVENTSKGTVVFDVEGLERMFGSYLQIAEQVAGQVRARGIQANVAVAANPDAAICTARGFTGITVVNRGTEAARLSDLPLRVLEPSPEILETLDRWGIRTLGAFAKLLPVQVAERLGQDGVKLHKMARGAGVRTLVPHMDQVRFVEMMDLDYDITTIEPLTFILSGMLEQICSRMRSRNLATHEVRLALGSHVRVLNLPLPVRNARLLTRLLILDLEAHPSGAAIRRVELEAFPAKPRVAQNGLFVPLSPEPEKLELTLARLKAVVGEENVGAAEILDTHRPDAFAVEKFGVGLRSTSPTGRSINTRSTSPTGRSINTRSASPTGRSINKCLNGLKSSLVLRVFRPAREATVQLRNETPTWIAFHGLHGPVATASGPWRTSGDWWRPNTWDREEWDIEVLDALYRIYYDVHLDRWYAQGVYD